MNEALVEQLIDLLADWDAVIEDVGQQCASGCSQTREAYFSGYADGVQAARAELAEMVARLMREESVTTGH